MKASRHLGGSAAATQPRTRTLWLLTLILLVTAGLIATPTTASASEVSGLCSNDNTQTEVQLLSGDFGLPLWLGVQSGVPDNSPTVAVCYGTGAPGETKTLGGYLQVRDPSVYGLFVRNSSDESSAIQAPAWLRSKPSYTVEPGGVSGGQAITFQIPFSICSGVCYSAPDGGILTTGLILGQINQKPASPGGVSAAYGVSELCLMVNGIQVTNCDQDLGDTGVTTTGTSPVNVGTSSGPCVVGICIPGNVSYVGTTGNQLATVYLPGVGSTPVYGTRVCLYQKDPGTACPA